MNALSAYYFGKFDIFSWPLFTLSFIYHLLITPSFFNQHFTLHILVFLPLIQPKRNISHFEFFCWNWYEVEMTRQEHKNLGINCEDLKDD